THEITVVDPLNEIGAYLRDAIPDTIENDVVFLYQHPDYDINVSYQTNSLYIDNEGKVTKDAENRQVTINIHVTLGNRSKTFYKSAVVTMIAVETQLANTRAWFKNLALVSNEEGLLPEVDGVYGRSIFWIGSDPGMIINQHLFPSLEAKTVKLQAFFTIAHRKYLYEYEYISKGVNPMEKLSALKRFMDGYFPSIAGKRLNLPYEEEVIITQSLVYPNTINRMRPGTGLVGKKMPGGVKYIVIHDTGMSGATGTAVGVKDYIHAQANSVTGRVASWHYTIDDKDCFQHVPDDEIAWHAGDGSSAYGSTYFNKEYQAWSIGGGNQNGIGIETCINQGGNYQRTLQRTAKLVASLLIKHHLGLDAIKQHNDFSGKNCPAVIRSSSGRWSEFLKMVEWHLMMNSFDANYSVKTSISNPSAIGKDGIVKQNLINDENVLLSFDITLGIDVLHYEYHVLAKGMTTSEKF
ncbi:MAG TPA: N-acetylmuramoyl-L-alanine amidase, partial [Bacilli bacterium]|nr:N-acetylmuramoyl-L-alanine amidase [Bacilli bacterium]